MCGLCGIVNLKKAPAKSSLARMNKALVHRGPDQGGLFLNKRAGLGSRRLSIVDSQGGRQPIFNEDKSLVIVYNGEVYNHLKLKNELAKKGHRFQTETDTETILHLYEEEGEKCLQKIRGMFALAIYDQTREQLFLARDHFGLKPLHYYFKNGLFLFASEIKALLAHPQVNKRLDLDGLNQYFSTGFGCIPAPLTVFKDIKKLLPGHYLIFSRGRIQIRKYWTLEKVKKIDLEFPEAKKEFLSLLKKSVQEQTMADRRVFGSFLSGGIDSSVIAALASQFIPGKIKTFSIGFPQASFDESSYAQKAAQFIPTEHHHRFFSQKEILPVLEHLAKNMDEPLADSSLLPTYFLSKFTREQVKVAFSGDGGDELLGGYPTYQAHQIYSFYQKAPLFLRQKIIQPLVQLLPASFANISLDYQLKRFVSGDSLIPPIRHLVWLAPFSLTEKKELFLPAVRRKFNPQKAPEKLFTDYFQQGKNFDRQDRLQYLDLKTYLGDFGLVKADRASNLASLEVRTPFLQPQLVEFIFSLPSKFRLKGLTTKYLLKEAAADLLPEEIIKRKKKGFGSPIALWINNQLKDLIEEKLNRSRIKKQGLFNPHFVSQLLEEHFGQQRNNRMKIWSLFMFQLWWDNWWK